MRVGFAAFVASVDRDCHQLEAIGFSIEADELTMQVFFEDFAPFPAGPLPNREVTATV